MGRNFDWTFHPVLVLITRPAGGYSSISVVDMSYTWRLVDAPRWPFDGMNERGLAVGMLMVDEAQSACELGMPSISSFGIIRLVLDQAATIDSGGASAVVEYYRGKLQVFRAEKSWQVTTNFAFSKTPDAVRSASCWRYALATDRLLKTGGRMEAKGVFGLLEAVSQPNTVWSSSYDLTGTRLKLALGRRYAKTYSWDLKASLSGPRRSQDSLQTVKDKVQSELEICSPIVAGTIGMQGNHFGEIWEFSRGESPPEGFRCFHLPSIAGSKVETLAAESIDVAVD